MSMRFGVSRLLAGRSIIVTPLRSRLMRTPVLGCGTSCNALTPHPNEVKVTVE
jgi:hypothetical protein